MEGPDHRPLHNGVLRNGDGAVRFRSSSEKGTNRSSTEDKPLDRHVSGIPISSSPTFEEDTDPRIYTESTKGDFEDGEGTYTTPAILEEDEEDPQSHAAMTRRAEEILANAKRRLTVRLDEARVSRRRSDFVQNMEGNLNRARSTLQTRASSSMSLYGDQRPETVSQYILRGKGRNPAAFSPTKHRQNKLSSLDEATQGHSRVFSETSVPSSLQTGLLNGQNIGESAGEPSGLGIEEDVAVHDRHSEPSRNWFWNGLARETSLKHAKRPTNGLEALDEDGPAPSFEPQATKADNSEGNDVHAHSIATATFDEQNPPNTGLTRARSTAQMHELREQMQDLKGKISSLKQRAREDNLRRRSLQSLRTPSPFTVAEQWYTGAPLPEDIQREKYRGARLDNIQSANADHHPEAKLQDSGHTPPEAEHRLVKGVDTDALGKEKLQWKGDQDRQEIEGYPTDERKIMNGSPNQKGRLVLVDDTVIAETDGNDQISSSFEETSPIDNETTEDSLYGDQDYHEIPTSPIVERHEDRPDAFDYEHFILSSALGNYSGVGVRRSSSNRKRANSQSSESSVETTKPRYSTGDPIEANNHTNGGHIRKDSVDSVSTDNTFATANEGGGRDEDQDDWTFGHTRAGSRQVEPWRKHITQAGNGDVSKSHPSNGMLKQAGKKHIASVQQGRTNGVSRKSPPAAPQLENGDPPEPPDVLTALLATDAWQEGAPPSRLNLGDRDKELLERLVKSLAKVCSEVQSLASDGSSMYEARVLRRKLDAARRVLDGEMNGEAF